MTGSSPEITVIIPNWNGRSWLPGCLDALRRQSFRDFVTLVVDNGSTDDSVAWLKSNDPAIRVIQLPTNAGFAAAVNTGLQAAATPLIALLNNDTEADPHWLSVLHAALITAPDQVAAVCGKMVQWDRPDLVENAGDVLTWQGAAEKRGHGKPANEYDQPGEIFSVCAGGALYRKTFFDQTGLFDERYFAYLEDIDLGLRGNLQGYRFLYEPRAVLRHKGHGSALPSARYVRLTTANRLRLFAKHIPARLLVQRLPSLLYGQWYFLVGNRHPIASLLGYWDFVKDSATICRQRREFQPAITLNHEAIEARLERRMTQPGIVKAIRNRWLGGQNP